MISTPLLLAVLAVATLMALAMTAFAVGCRHENRKDRIVVLLYHRVTSDQEYAEIEPRDEKIYSIPERRFREHVGYLRANGYYALRPDRLLAYLEGRERSIPRRSVLITFDDGCESVYTRALPILKEQGFPGIVFITTDPESPVFHTGNAAQRRVTEEETRELSAAGITIGSHAVSHRPLGGLSAGELAGELEESKRYLERVVDSPVDLFGVPFNWYGARVREAAKHAGYRAVFTSDCGTVYRGSDRFHLRRITIEGSYSVEDLVCSLRPSRIVQRRVVGALKRLPARLLGPRIWMPLRAALLRSQLGRVVPQNRFRWLVAAIFVFVAFVIGLAVYLAA